MAYPLTSTIKNQVLGQMAQLLDDHHVQIAVENQKDLDKYAGPGGAMYDRLIITESKINGMRHAIQEVIDQPDPVGVVISETKRPNNLRIENRTTAFGTILIIYESRPDVTIEAAALAFKAGNQILLKGGKEAHHSNRYLTQLWHQALASSNLSTDWITYLELSRTETQSYLQNPTQKIDLIVPRGGERLIQYVKAHASCPVLVSGRGNNFLYVAPDADWPMTMNVILNAKTDKTSACNALDKVVLDIDLPNYKEKLNELIKLLQKNDVNVQIDTKVSKDTITTITIADDKSWDQEFLSLEILIGNCKGVHDAIRIINTHSGGHSNAIMTSSPTLAHEFMNGVDSAAVYHNASTRFTDGGQMGVGAELAISTDKLHHRGPLGLKQLVTNKYFIFGEGQTR